MLSESSKNGALSHDDRSNAAHGDTEEERNSEIRKFATKCVIRLVGVVAKVYEIRAQPCGSSQ